MAVILLFTIPTTLMLSLLRSWLSVATLKSHSNVCYRNNSSSKHDRWWRLLLKHIKGKQYFFDGNKSFVFAMTKLMKHFQLIKVQMNFDQNVATTSPSAQFQIFFFIKINYKIYWMTLGQHDKNFTNSINKNLILILVLTPHCSLFNVKQKWNNSRWHDF